MKILCFKFNHITQKKYDLSMGGKGTKDMARQGLPISGQGRAYNFSSLNIFKSFFCFKILLDMEFKKMGLERFFRQQIF